MYYDHRENEFLGAMVETSDEGFDKKAWLIKHFELYKSILNWPKGLPPICRCEVKSGTIAYLFYINYSNTLREFDHKFDNDRFTFVLGDELPDEDEQSFL